MSWLRGRQLIERIGHNADEKTSRVFNGVYPIHQLPEFVFHYLIFIIINTDTHRLGGNHWEAIFIDEKRRGEVFDSFLSSSNNGSRKEFNFLNQVCITHRNLLLTYLFL